MKLTQNSKDFIQFVFYCFVGLAVCVFLGLQVYKEYRRNGNPLTYYDRCTKAGGIIVSSKYSTDVCVLDLIGRGAE